MTKQGFADFFKSRRPEQVFLWLAIPLIGLFIVVIPPLQGFDEATHFLRAYQVSEGRLMPERFAGHRAGGHTPDNIVDMSDTAVSDIIQSAKSDLAVKTSPLHYAPYVIENHPTKMTVEKYFAGSAVYSPVSYAPQAAGIFMARTLRLPLLSYIYIGRIFNAAAFIALIYLAIRMITRGKWVIFALAMLPTSLTEASSLSPDPLVIGAGLLLAALFVKGLLAGKLSNKNLLIIAATIALLSLTKQTYFLLAGLPLFLPIKAFGSFKRYALWNAGFIVLALAATFGWYAQVADIAKYSYLDSQPTVHISASEQEKLILHNPVRYAGILGWQMFGHFNPQYTQIAGFLTWKGIVMPQVINFLVYFGLVMAFFVSFAEKAARPVLSRWQKLVASLGPIALGFVITVVIYTALYVSFNSVGSGEIQGVQGRYFIPLIALLLPAVLLARPARKPFISFDSEKAKVVLPTIFLIQNVAALIVVFGTNYIPHVQFV